MITAKEILARFNEEGDEEYASSKDDHKDMIMDVVNDVANGGMSRDDAEQALAHHFMAHDVSVSDIDHSVDHMHSEWMPGEEMADGGEANESLSDRTKRNLKRAAFLAGSAGAAAAGVHMAGGVDHVKELAYTAAKHVMDHAHRAVDHIQHHIKGTTPNFTPDSDHQGTMNHTHELSSRKQGVLSSASHEEKGFYHKFLDGFKSKLASNVTSTPFVLGGPAAGTQGFAHLGAKTVELSHAAMNMPSVAANLTARGVQNLTTK